MKRKRYATTRKGHNVSKSKERGNIWVIAVDPFSDLDQTPVIEFAKRLGGKTGVEIVATYVLAPANFNWNGDFSGPWITRYRPLAEERMQKIYGKYKIRWEVITCREPGLRESAQKLIQWTRKIKATGMIISTHGRRGLARWALGSFAETTILASDKIPVLVINPERSVPKSVNKVLVPTDLSKSSRRFILGLVPTLKALGSGLHLFYKKPDPLDPIIQQGVYSLGGGWISAQSFLDDENDRNTKELKLLVQHIEESGVNCNSAVNTAPENLAESINKAVKNQGADMIAILTQSGPLAATLLGSVARDLIRSANVPVWIQRSRR